MLGDQLRTALKEAMKARDETRLRTVRLLVSALQYERIAKGTDLSEDEEIGFLTRQAKQREESIALYEQGGREDLAAVERGELVIIKTYLPEQLSAEEVRRIAAAVISEVGASSKKEMGRVMSALMPKLKGRFPGKDVRPIVDALLGQ
jgi:uncharacterized protein YqeY